MHTYKFQKFILFIWQPKKVLKILQHIFFLGVILKHT